MFKKHTLLVSLLLTGGAALVTFHLMISNDTYNVKRSQESYGNSLFLFKGIKNSLKAASFLNLDSLSVEIEKTSPLIKNTIPKSEEKKSSSNKDNMEQQQQQQQQQQQKQQRYSPDIEDRNDPPVYHKIITWAQYSKPRQGEHLMTCPSKSKCYITSDRSNLDGPSQHSIVAFEFFNAYFNVDDLPLPRKPHHRWALIHNESPDKSRLFSFQEAMEAFNYTSTFKRESDYPITLQSVPDPMEWIKPKLSFTVEEKDRFQKDDGLAPIIYVQSHLHGVSSDRESYVAELMKYIAIDSYGRSLHNKDIPKEFNNPSKKYGHYNDLKRLESRYKFEISFENAICKDYNTEKLFRPLSLGVVPIYKGSPSAGDFLPSVKSAIFIDDFDSPKHLAEFLLYLNRNNTAYEEYRLHHKTGITNPLLQELLEDEQFYKKPAVDHPEKYDIFYSWLRSIRCYFCDRMHEEYTALQSEDTEKLISIAEVNHVGCQRPKEAIEGKINTPQHQEAIRCYEEGKKKALKLQQRLRDN